MVEKHGDSKGKKRQSGVFVQGCRCLLRLSEAFVKNAASDYLSSLDDDSADSLFNCLKRIGWWFADSGAPQKERLNLWLFRDGEAQHDSFGGFKQSQIETPAERIRDSIPCMKYAAEIMAFPCDCVALAAFIRRGMQDRGPYGIFKCVRDGLPPGFRPKIQQDDIQYLFHDTFKLERSRFKEFCVRFDGALLDEQLFKAAKQLDLPIIRLTLQDATFDATSDFKKVNSDVQKWLRLHQKSTMEAVWDRKDLPHGWEPKEDCSSDPNLAAYPNSKISTPAELCNWLNSWLQTMHESRKSGRPRADKVLNEIQRELRNSCRAFEALEISLPANFNDEPDDINRAEKQLKVLINTLTESMRDVQDAIPPKGKGVDAQPTFRVELLIEGRRILGENPTMGSNDFFFKIGGSRKVAQSLYRHITGKKKRMTRND